MSLTNIALARQALSISYEASIWAEHALINENAKNDQFDMDSSRMLIARLEHKLADLKKALTIKA